MGGMEGEEVVCVIEDCFLHEAWWAGIVKQSIERVIWLSCVVSEIG